MVSSSHEALHRIFQKDTRLFSRAFNRLLEVDFPEALEVAVINPEATEIKPLERRIDTLLKVDTEQGPYLLVIEAQGKKDPGKTHSWPYYLSYLYAKYKWPPVLLVLCQRKSTAYWASEPIEVGLPGRPTLTVHPHVLSPENVPAVTTPDEAAEDLPLAVFSALTHSKESDMTAILDALSEALDSVDQETAAFFAEFTEVGLAGSQAHEIWKALMTPKLTYYRSPWAEALREEGRERGREEGREEGLAEGAQQARIAAHREFVLRTLDARELPVPRVLRDLITSCEDADLLESWVDRAFHVERAQDLLAEE